MVLVWYPLLLCIVLGVSWLLVMEMFWLGAASIAWVLDVFIRVSNSSIWISSLSFPSFEARVLLGVRGDVIASSVHVGDSGVSSMINLSLIGEEMDWMSSSSVLTEGLALAMKILGAGGPSADVDESSESNLLLALLPFLGGV